MIYRVSCLPHSMICEIWDVWGSLSRKGRPNGHEYFIDVRNNPSLNVGILGLRRMGLGVVEIWGELSPSQYNFRNFGRLGLVE
jgi:hypothetical protein